MSIQAETALESSANDLFLSTASVWEMAIKMKLGRLTLAGGVRLGFFIGEAMRRMELNLLDVSYPHAIIPEKLPLHHTDPFDRLLVAQRLHEGMAIISIDAKLDPYNIVRIW